MARRAVIKIIFLQVKMDFPSRCRSAIMAPKPIVPMENGVDPREVEALIYMSVGVAIAFLLTASMMFAVCQCIAK